MIELIPAIDIIDGKCVRLIRGDYSRKTVYADSPVDVAKHFEALGFTRLHVVDLDGARQGRLSNVNILEKISQATSLTIDFGGGIKSRDDIQRILDSGASMVTVGSVAATNPDIFKEWLRLFGPEKIILCADVRNGQIAIHGWKDNTGIDLLSFIETYVKSGVSQILCSDISKDGTLQGPALPLYREIMSHFPSLHLIASGGISSNQDIEALEQADIPAVVFGKAYYEGKIDVSRLNLQHDK